MDTSTVRHTGRDDSTYREGGTVGPHHTGHDRDSDRNATPHGHRHTDYPQCRSVPDLRLTRTGPPAPSAPRVRSVDEHVQQTSSRGTRQDSGTPSDPGGKRFVPTQPRWVDTSVGPVQPPERNVHASVGSKCVSFPTSWPKPGPRDYRTPVGPPLPDTYPCYPEGTSPSEVRVPVVYGPTSPVSRDGARCGVGTGEEWSVTGSVGTVRSLQNETGSHMTLG